MSITADRIRFSLDVIVPRVMEFGLLRMPKEACGVIVPELSAPVDQWVLELVNRSESPENSYLIDGETLRTISADPEVWDDCIIWHTHPSGNVGPSRRDLEYRIPGIKYLVVALPRGEAVLF
jgi:proteasome lid subunit RPN8/RPN11